MPIDTIVPYLVLAIYGLITTEQVCEGTFAGDGVPDVRSKPNHGRQDVGFISKVLFPVDFSSACIHMAGYVKLAAYVFHAEVSLLHVVEIESHNGFELYMRSPREIAEDHWSAARGELDGFLIREFPMADYPRLLSSGDAAMEIIRIAKVGGFDLIMMPTHSGLMKQIFLGSTTSKVINDSNIPVLTTRHTDTITLRAPDSVGTSDHLPSANARGAEVDAKVLVGTNV